MEEGQPTIHRQPPAEPLSRQPRRARRDLAARASRKQAAEAIANLRQLIHLDVRLAVNEGERSRQQIDAS